MTMTSRDYNAIADALRKSRAPERVRRAVATALAETNPKFNTGRFLTASDPKELHP